MSSQKDYKTVLLVDEDKNWHAYMAMLLSHPLVNLIPTISAKHAWQILPSLGPSAVLLDVDLPDVGGLNLLELMMEECGPIPIIVFFSGLQNNTVTADVLIERGATLVLSKADARSLPGILYPMLGL